MAENREFQHFMVMHSLLLAPIPASPDTSRTSTDRAKASLVGGNKEGETDGLWQEDISPTLRNLCHPLGVTLPLGFLSSFPSAPFPPLAPLHKALPILPMPREAEG